MLPSLMQTLSINRNMKTVRIIAALKLVIFIWCLAFSISALAESSSPVLIASLFLTNSWNILLIYYVF